jgi:hypothetical protein
VPILTTTSFEVTVAPAISTSLQPAPSTYTLPPAVSTNAPAPAQSTYTLPANPIETLPHSGGQVLTASRHYSSFTASAAAAIPASPAISSSTQSQIPLWNGGPLLVGTCGTPGFSLVYGPNTATMFDIGIVGCQGNKPDCCPFPVAPRVVTTDATVTKTVGGPSVSNRFIFPAAVTPRQVTLSRCPEDYVTISSVCCPS